MYPEIMPVVSRPRHSASPVECDGCPNPETPSHKSPPLAIAAQNTASSGACALQVQRGELFGCNTGGGWERRGGGGVGGRAEGLEFNLGFRVYSRLR